MKNIIAIIFVLVVAGVAHAQHWTYPGPSIQLHLMTNHGQADDYLGKLTHEEQLDLHDALHVNEGRKQTHTPTILMHGSASCAPCLKWWNADRSSWKSSGWFVRKLNEINFTRSVPWFEITDGDGVRFEVDGPLTREKFLSARKARLAKRQSVME